MLLLCGVVWLCVVGWLVGVYSYVLLLTVCGWCLFFGCSLVVVVVVVVVVAWLWQVLVGAARGVG